MMDLHPAVDSDLESAYRWYENQRPLRGVEFLEEVDRIFDEIEANPARYGYADKIRRVGLLKRFPYAVYYRVIAGRPRILAVQHTARSPREWKSRN